MIKKLKTIIKSCIIWATIMQQVQAQSDSALIKTLTDGEVAYIKEAFKPDSEVAAAINILVAGKYAAIYKDYMFGFSDKAKSNALIKAQNKKENLYNIYPALYDKKYIDDYLKKIEAITKIPDTSLQNIKASFHASISADKYLDWGKAINNAVQKYFPDTAIFSALYHSQFKKEAFELSAADYYNLINEYRVSPNAISGVFDLIKEKNYKKAVLQYTYAMYHPALFDRLVRLTTQYYDSTIKVALLLDGYMLPASQFAVALKYKNILNLRTSLIDTLLQCAIYLSKKRDSILNKDPFAVTDFGDYEAERLTNLLTEDQYTTVLSFKNRSLARHDAESDWAEMELRGITAGFDKEKTIAEITNYYIAKYNAWNRLANDKISQWAAIKVIGDNKPKALKILDPLRWGGSTQKNNNNLNLKW